MGEAFLASVREAVTTHGAPNLDMDAEERQDLLQFLAQIGQGDQTYVQDFHGGMATEG